MNRSLPLLFPRRTWAYRERPSTTFCTRTRRFSTWWTPFLTSSSSASLGTCSVQKRYEVIIQNVAFISLFCGFFLLIYLVMKMQNRFFRRVLVKTSMASFPSQFGIIKHMPCQIQVITTTNCYSKCYRLCSRCCRCMKLVSSVVSCWKTRGGAH